MNSEGDMRALSVEEREEIFIDIARQLDRTALESMVEGNRKFAMVSKNMADAIFISADELARDDSHTPVHVMKQARELVRQFEAVHPHRMRSHAIH
ncbi:hypothetical protein [Rhizobium grahamii]|uniref:Uncharacterized protein n=1 Tax=Rhizobium grahamii CCGE 502 TaxID=990285 RepID=S3HDZ5_9HYPH|nr:hypothetical protein [Rhizobium grahamii]EPE97057.1 hypothetical protein RGCCGE502_16875 [Rhizobium grahamii CCGE 502]